MKPQVAFVLGAILASAIHFVAPFIMSEDFTSGDLLVAPEELERDREAAQQWARDVIEQLRSSDHHTTMNAVVESWDKSCDGRPYISDRSGRFEGYITEEQFELIRKTLTRDNAHEAGLSRWVPATVDGFARITQNGEETVVPQSELLGILYAESVFNFEQGCE